jgi:hypothetical protein
MSVVGGFAVADSRGALLKEDRLLADFFAAASAAAAASVVVGSAVFRREAEATGNMGELGCD